MQPEHWQNWDDPREFLRTMPLWDRTAVRWFNDRKLRLFAVACCRGALAACRNPLVLAAVEAVEYFVDAKANADRQNLKTVRKEMFVHKAWSRTTEGRLARAVIERNPWAAAIQTSRYSSYLLGGTPDRTRQERCNQGPLLRDVIGDPFGCMTTNRRWLTYNVVALARSIYDGRDFHLLPVLGDALEDAGCTDRLLLDHCRCTVPHTRGCWLTDLILSKSR
jgi:hypothetical protein